MKPTHKYFLKSFVGTSIFWGVFMCIGDYLMDHAIDPWQDYLIQGLVFGFVFSLAAVWFKTWMLQDLGIVDITDEHLKKRYKSTVTTSETKEELLNKLKKGVEGLKFTMDQVGDAIRLKTKGDLWMTNRVIDVQFGAGDKVTITGKSAYLLSSWSSKNIENVMDIERLLTS